jgi:hypothetical protein
MIFISKKSPSQLIDPSALAQAASEETASQMMLLPEHYELMENWSALEKVVHLLS